VEAAREIVVREKLSGRNAVLKRIKEKYSGFLG
jgi:hypothetical protein